MKVESGQLIAHSLAVHVVTDRKQNLRSPRRNKRQSTQVARSFVSLGSKPFCLTFSRCCSEPQDRQLDIDMMRNHGLAPSSSCQYVALVPDSWLGGMTRRQLVHAPGTRPPMVCGAGADRDLHGGCR